MESQTQSFNDGIVSIYLVENLAEDGDMPKDKLTKKVGPLRYEERTVGMTRFFTGMQNQAKISQIFRTPRINSVSIQDIAIPNDKNQYKIIQVQYPPNIEPPCMDLSLERLVENYDVG